MAGLAGEDEVAEDLVLALQNDGTNYTAATNVSAEGSSVGVGRWYDPGLLGSRFSLIAMCTSGPGPKPTNPIGSLAL